MRKIQYPFIIDVEASGFGVFSYPIEVGVAMSSHAKYCSLIEPAPRWTHWDSRAEAFHHIQRSQLIEHGRPVYQVATQLNQLLQGATVYSDGWVVDRPWLITLFDAARLEMSFHVSALEMILSEKQMEIWHSTKSQILEESQGVRHRASYDAWVVQETFRRTQAAIS